MIDLRRLAQVVVGALVLTCGVAAEQSPAGQQPAAPQPAPTPAATPTQVPGTVTCPVAAPPATLPVKHFVAPAGMLLQPVSSSKLGDFQKFLAFVQEAIASSTDEIVRRQAKGWKSYQVAEVGPNGDVLFAFVFEPAVPCVDYGFNQILSAAVPDPATLNEIWALYKSSVKGGGTLLNLVPFTGPTTPAAGSTPGSKGTENAQPPQRPLDANPNVPPK